MKMNIHLKKQLIRRVCALLIATISIGLIFNLISPSGLPLRKVVSDSVVEKDIPAHTSSVYGHKINSVSVIKADQKSAERRTDFSNISKNYSNETIKASFFPLNRREFFKDSDNYNLNQVTWKDVKPLLEKEAIVLVDSRSIQAFEAGHIPGAISLPLATLTEEIGSFTNMFSIGTPIVVYCSNRRCGIAKKLSNSLINHYGYSDVRIMPGGYLEWRQAEL